MLREEGQHPDEDVGRHLLRGVPFAEGSAGETEIERNRDALLVSKTKTNKQRVMLGGEVQAEAHLFLRLDS